MQRQDAEIQALRGKCQQQRETVEKQAAEMHSLQTSLRNYRNVDNDQVSGEPFEYRALTAHSHQRDLP